MATASAAIGTPAGSVVITKVVPGSSFSLNTTSFPSVMRRSRRRPPATTNKTVHGREPPRRPRRRPTRVRERSTGFLDPSDLDDRRLVPPPPLAEEVHGADDGHRRDRTDDQGDVARRLDARVDLAADLAELGLDVGPHDGLLRCMLRGHRAAAFGGCADDRIDALFMELR